MVGGIRRHSPLLIMNVFAMGMEYFRGGGGGL